MARLVSHLHQVQRAAQRGGVEGLHLGAEHLLQVARSRVPLEESTLERSGVASVDPDRLTAAVSFDTPYAVRQHEELTWRHDPGRTPKYLEGPANEEQPTILALLAEPLRAELE